MYTARFFVCIVVYATAVLATCRIEYPGGVEYWWVSSRPNVVGWSCEADAPAEYYDLVPSASRLHNYDTSLLAKPTTVAHNVSHRDCVKVINDLPDNLTEGRGYYLQLADANLATVYAVSEPFEIKSRDAGYPSTCMNSTTTPPRPTASPTCAFPTPSSTLLPSTPTSAHIPPISTPSTPSANLVAGHADFEHGERRSPIWDMPDWLAFFCLGGLAASASRDCVQSDTTVKRYFVQRLIHAGWYSLCVFAATASATFSIENPGGDDSWWVADNQNIVQWTCNDEAPDSYYNIVILNNDTSLLAEASTVATNVSNWDCSELIESSQSNYTAGTGYYIELTSVDGASVYATSDSFEIKASGSTYPSSSDFHLFSGLLYAHDLDRDNDEVERYGLD
ncbi:uncharacterized protein SCHCODRAFT_02679559 [Schizophyllum commune H4-8]|uniref:Yeast cell wall synthesis Kre9/Knh1-like N-terminal domain-containing protein n=1 Tax=Schizophyllum commune (strain H4-8 / FGSC 9210) TaxID=578458 RepID=D8Q8Y9_SCHCM|nr:uncharacterized protein SCHCODRAFT_02679559 [Schizophyllum commune H4-8]KAI5890619.1 hypothetical protein SCHCODRAFT_02679559 [Schizophyllum commune H4-8]